MAFRMNVALQSELIMIKKGYFFLIEKISCDFHYSLLAGGQQNVNKLVAKAMFWFIGKLECGNCNVLLQGILGAKSSKLGFLQT